MGTQGTAKIISGVAGILGVLVLATLCIPMAWLHSESAVMKIKVDLWTVKLGHGLTTGGLSFLTSAVGLKSASAGLDQLFNKNFWMHEGVSLFCGPGIDMVFKWCGSWNQIFWASTIMLILGFLAVIFLWLGGVFVFYYAHEHATHTGRMGIRWCFVLAPFCSCAGILQYTFLTWDFGSFGSNVFTNSRSLPGEGFILMWALAFFSFIPLLVHGVFFKVSKTEKTKGGDDDDDLAEGGYGPNYNTMSYDQNPSPPPGEAYGGAQNGASTQEGFGLPPATGGPPVFGSQPQPTMQPAW